MTHSTKLPKPAMTAEQRTAYLVKITCALLESNREDRYFYKNIGDLCYSRADDKTVVVLAAEQILHDIERQP